MTTKATPKKEEPRDRLAPEILSIELNYIRENAPMDHPVKGLTDKEFTDIVDELATVADELFYYGMHICGVQGKGFVQAFCDDGKGPVRLANMTGHGSFCGGTEAGERNGVDGIRRGLNE